MPAPCVPRTMSTPSPLHPHTREQITAAREGSARTAPSSNASTRLHTSRCVPDPFFPCKLSPCIYLSPSRTWESPKASVGALGVRQ